MPGKLVPHGDFESFVDEVEAEGGKVETISADTSGVFVTWSVKRRTGAKETR